MIQTVQGSVISTREVQVQRTTQSDTSQVNGSNLVLELLEMNTATTWFDPICQSFLVDQY